jgi:hypothetical protein
MEKLEIPSNINTIAIPTGMITGRLGKKNDAFILVIMKRKPMIDIGCGARHRCLITVDMLPSGGVKLFNIEPEPGLIPTPKLMLARQLSYGQFKIAILYGWAVDDLEKGELVSTYVMLEKPEYLVFERVSNNEFKLSNKEPEAAVVVYSYELDSRVTCADIEVLESELLSQTVCSTCCATRSYSLLLGIGKEGQKVRFKQRSAYYREELPDVEKTFIVKNMRLVETINADAIDVI